MQLDHFNAQLSRSIDLLHSWIDEQAHANPRKLQAFDGCLEFLALCNDIESSFRRHFFTFFRNETDFIRHNAQRNVDNLLCIAHFEIQFRHDVLAQSLDISVLNVAAISAQMGYAASGAAALSN